MAGRYGVRAITMAVVLLIGQGTLFAQFSEGGRAAYERESLVGDRFENARLVLEGDLEPFEYNLRAHQLGELDPAELRILRNTIFAQYGYRFRSADLQRHFSRFDWYKPDSEFSESRLSYLDRGNIDRIRAFETAYSGSSGNTVDTAKLTGEWHGSPMVAAGYTELYFLDGDGTFEWHGNKMDLGKRLYSMYGTWRIDGPFLLLTVERYTWLYGGELVEPYASNANFYGIESGEFRDVVPPDGSFNLRLPLGDYGRHPQISAEMGADVISVRIGGYTFFKWHYRY